MDVVYAGEVPAKIPKVKNTFEMPILKDLVADADPQTTKNYSYLKEMYADMRFRLINPKLMTYVYAYNGCNTFPDLCLNG